MKFRLKDKYFNLNLKENNIEAVIITGSFVCGEFDEKSNIDFCIVTDDCANEELLERKRRITNELGVSDSSVNIFTKRSFKKLCFEGNRYLYGAKYFRKILYKKSDYISNVFEEVDANLDINELIKNDIELLDEVFQEYKIKKTSAEKTISIIAKVVRNICIDICYLTDNYDITKYQAVKNAIKVKFVNIPFSFDEYEVLYNMKRKYCMNNDYTIKGYLYGYIVMWYNKYIELSKNVLKKLI